MAELIEALSQRRARRAFAADLVPADMQDALWQAVSVAPSHGNAQPVRLVVVETAAGRESLFAALSEGNRQWAGAAPLLVAVAVRPADDSEQQNSDGTVREIWAFHAGIATANLLAQATAMGLVAHPMAGFDEPGVRTALGIPGGVRVQAVVAIGFPGAVDALVPDLQKRETAPQKRLPASHLVARERWGAEQDVTWKAYRDAQERA